MADRMFKDRYCTLTPGFTELHGYFTTTTSGVIATGSTSKSYGFSVIKTAAQTGRYTITLEDNYAEFLGIDVVLTGPASAIFVLNKGFFLGCRNLPAAGVGFTNSTRTFNIQFGVTADAAHTDTDIADGAAVYLTIKLKNSSITR